MPRLQNREKPAPFGRKAKRMNPAGDAPEGQDPDVRAAETLKLRYERRSMRRLLILRLLFAWVFAWSFSRMYYPMLWMPARPLENAAWIAGSLLFLLFLSYNKVHTLASLLLGTAALAAFLIFGQGLVKIPEFFRGIPRMVDILNHESQLIAEAGVPPELWAFDAEVSGAVIFVQRSISSAIALLAYLCVTRYPVPLILSSMMLFFLSVTYMAPADTPVLWMIPMVLAVLLASITEYDNAVSRYAIVLNETKIFHRNFSFRRYGKLTLQYLLPILLAVLVSFAFMPVFSHKDVFSPRLQGLMDDLTSMLPRSYLEKLSLNDFGLDRAGYYPLEKEIGGVLELRDDPMFTLSGKSGKLLAGVYYDNFSGLRWHRMINNPYYRFNSVLDRKTQQSIFPPSTAWLDEEEGRAERWSEDLDYSMTPLDEFQAVFQAGITQQVEQVRRESRLLYYNAARNLYSKENFAVDTPLRIRAVGRKSPFDRPLDEASSADIEALKAGGIPEFQSAAELREFIYNAYLQIPDYEAYKPGGYVYELTQEVVHGVQHPVDQVRAVYDFLRGDGFTYTFSPPPRQQHLDVVTDFLQQRQGYCVYFASAASQMIRILGIPARYVEGFAVPSEGQALLAAGETFELNGLHAHAWVEVYLDGLGWVSVDPTPGGVDSAVNLSKDPPEPPPTQPTTTPAPETTPSTTPEPSTTPSSRNSVPSSTTEPETGPQSRHSVLFPLLLVLLFLLLAAALCILRYYYKRHLLEKLHDRKRIRAKFPDAGDRLALYWDLLRELILSADPLLYEKSGGRPEHARGGLEEEFKEIISAERYRGYSQELKNEIRAVYASLTEAYFAPEGTDAAAAERAAELFDKLEEQLVNELGKREYYKQRITVQERLRSGTPR